MAHNKFMVSLADALKIAWQHAKRRAGLAAAERGIGQGDEPDEVTPEEAMSIAMDELSQHEFDQVQRLSKSEKRWLCDTAFPADRKWYI